MKFNFLLFNAWHNAINYCVKDNFCTFAPLNFKEK